MSIERILHGEIDCMYSRRLISIVGFICLLVLPGWLLFRQDDPFTSFTLELNTSGSVYVQWRTNISQVQFEVQRSRDEKVWETIKTISPQLVTQYAYLDTRPIKGINHYRIKLTDKDNEIYFSEVSSIELINNTDCYLWPQPATSVLHVEVPFSYGTLEIIDASGRTSQRSSLSGFRSEIPISNLPSGIYFARIKYGNKVWMQKFIKQ